MARINISEVPSVNEINELTDEEMTSVIGGFLVKLVGPIVNGTIGTSGSALGTLDTTVGALGSSVFGTVPTPPRLN